MVKLFLLILPGAAEIACKMRIFFQSLIPMARQHLPVGIYPVSYTHLDVYKRQKETIEKATGQVIRRDLVLDNHSEVMYDYNLIPKDQIRG